MNALSYLIQVNVYLILFYGLYLMMLRNETFFKMNRFYLVGSAILSMVIPLMKVRWIKDLFVPEQIYQATQMVNTTLNEVVLNAPQTSEDKYGPASDVTFFPDGIDAAEVFRLIYAGVTLLLLLDFMRKLYLVNRTLKSGAKLQAFSFFNKVVVDEELKGVQTIRDHEMVHVKQWHSLDVIFFELFTAFNWFNPIAFVCKRAIKNIHEFIADETAAEMLDSKTTYALLLVSNAFGTQAQQLTNSFYNDSLLKRRLVMLNKNKSRKVAILKYGLSVPLFAIMIIFSSATIEQSKAVKAVAFSIEKSIPIVMNAISNGEIPLSNDSTPQQVAYRRSSLAEQPIGVASAMDSVSLLEVNRYFAKSIKYPSADQEARKVGTTYLTFEIDEAGVLQNPSVVQAMSDISRTEVLRVLKNVEPFGKGMQGKYILAIKYSISSNTEDDLLRGSDTLDVSKYKGYKRLRDVSVRGYTKSTRVVEEPVDVVRRHFAKTIKYPPGTPKDIMASRTYLAFELDDVGKIINPKIIKSVGTSFEKEIKAAIDLAAPFGAGLKGKYIIILTFLYGIQNPDLSSLDKENLKDFKFLKSIIFTGYFKDGDSENLLTRGEYDYTLIGRSETYKTYPILEQAKERFRLY
jgi:hypothetical protein